MASSATCRSLDGFGLERSPRCFGAAGPPRLSLASSGVIQRRVTVDAREGASQRGLALEATCLDEVDFGVSQTNGAHLGGFAAKMLLQRNELKDQRKRWGESKLIGEREAATAKASSALAAKLSSRQPSMARIVLRAQYVKETVVYQGRGRDEPGSKRVRSRGQR